MRIAWLVLVLSTSSAVADPSPPTKPMAPTLVVTWQEGERSRDSSIWTTKIVVIGRKLYYTRSYAGRNSGMPGFKPTTLDAAVKDPKKVEAALAAFDKTTPAKAEPKGSSRPNLRRGCIQRGTVERCAEAGAKDPEELKAIAAVRDALLDGVALPTP